MVASSFGEANGVGRSDPITPLKQAVDLTLEVIHERARRYRNLVVGVSLIGLLLPVLALTTWSAVPLLGLLTLVPLFGLFLLLDYRQLGQWQSRLLALWLNHGLRLDIYSKTMKSHPHLPGATLGAMLDTLPRHTPPNDGPDGQNARRAISSIQRSMHAHRASSLLVFLCAEIIAVVALAMAVYLASPAPLLLLLVIPALWTARRVWERARVRSSRRAIADLLGGQAALSTFPELVGQLDWRGVSARTQRRWMATL
jgi:hypothetical protein